ncbi:MAG: hypothetical protein HC788_15020 [Sphingopyxis sp.]|nr:hypothetical protein [Sphingopyxis sp.]
MAQMAAIVVVEALGKKAEGKTVYFMSIEGAKFRQPVTPGDALELHIAIVRGRGKVWKFSGAARVGDTLAAEAEHPESLDHRNMHLAAHDDISAEALRTGRRSRRRCREGTHQPRHEAA